MKLDATSDPHANAPPAAGTESGPLRMSELTGFIGLGHMGGAMARRLLAAGHSLVVHDRDPQACREFAADGARAAQSPRAIADHAPVVFLCLPSIEASREVAGGLAGGSALQVVVETSTVGTGVGARTGQPMAAHDVAVVDAPVSGGPRGAQAGTLSLMHSGSKDALARVLPQLQRHRRRSRFDVGDRARAGAGLQARQQRDLGRRHGRRLRRRRCLA